MQVINKPIDEIKLYNKNPRKNDNAVNYVAASIREFGFKVPVIVDKDSVIVAGHTRIKAAKQLGLESVPVIVADDLTPDQVKAFRLADNKVGEIAEWDFEALEAELEDIEIDMSEFSFEISDDVFVMENDIESNTTKDGQYDKLKMPVNIGKLLLFMSRDDQMLYSQNMDVFYEDEINENEQIFELCKIKIGELADEIRNFIQI